MESFKETISRYNFCLKIKILTLRNMENSLDMMKINHTDSEILSLLFIKIFFKAVYNLIEHH